VILHPQIDRAAQPTFPISKSIIKQKSKGGITPNDPIQLNQTV